MCGEEADFADLPTQIKKTFTVTYNNYLKSSVKPVKKSKKVDEKGVNMFSGANFDPDFMS